MITLTWFATYEARFGKRLTECEIAVWEEEIERDIRNLEPGEITRAIRLVADEYRRDGKRKFAPTVNDVITAIIKGKYIIRNPTAGESFHTVLVCSGHCEWIRQEESESSWKSRLHKADPEQAWSVICEPVRSEECRERKAYCLANGISFIQSMITRSVR
jgi:hypothetical protein